MRDFNFQPFFPNGTPCIISPLAWQSENFLQKSIEIIHRKLDLVNIEYTLFKKRNIIYSLKQTIF